MASKDKPGQTNPVDDQMDRLAADLRDQGVAPQRDLWADIDRNISAAENRLLRPALHRRRTWPQFVATAAVVTVLLTAGWWGLQQRAGFTSAADPVASLEADTSVFSDMDVIDQALTEVNLALALDPDNRSLTHLALMLHQSRGRMMRQNMDMQLSDS